MHCITVSLVQAPEHLSIIINAGGTGNDFLLAVTVYIGNHAVMIAVTVTGSVFVISCVKRPTLYQLFIYHIIRSGSHTCVISASRNHAGMYAIQIRN